LHPWDIGRLTAAELNAYLDALAAIAEQHRDLARPMRR